MNAVAVLVATHLVAAGIGALVGYLLAQSAACAGPGTPRLRHVVVARC